MEKGVHHMLFRAKEKNPVADIGAVMFQTITFRHGEEYAKDHLLFATSLYAGYDLRLAPLLRILLRSFGFRDGKRLFKMEVSRCSPSMTKNKIV